ncbi:MAG: universal stress protein [Planctomycetales bacterium]|nr:universal stress protein [Planctomycetales bacterium]NIM09649.1 universal stress protein [Planctomycetales bacterium]NIN09132.1 universal stress protein [Planctomycetales bacterium]NIN78239.1 universal stress protein [Planctomycetales bacterium]NIO35430.1 universal stress protein [Planctomycetales bacterium]
MMEFDTVLVPVDFSEASEQAYDRALELVTGSNPLVVLLHVLDPGLADFSQLHGFGSAEETMRIMRQNAENKLLDYQQRKPSGVDVQTLLCEGVPFLEIVKKADELQVHAIVMGKVGTRGQVERMLFGSTAERVIRASTRPVLVLPWHPGR